MTNRIEQIEQMVGVPIGESGTPQKPFKDALSEIGLSFENTKQIRSGRSNGRVLFNLLNLREANQDPNSFLKNALYLKIATEVVASRHFGDGPYANRYSSRGLISNTSVGLASLGIMISNDQITRSFGNMRADLAYHYQEDNEGFTAFFNKLAEDYLKANAVLLPKGERGQAVVNLYEQWDRRSPATFYMLMYRLMGRNHASRSISSLVPYEAEAMIEFYRGRIRKGNIPSDYDIEVLCLRSRKDLLDFAEKVKNDSGVEVNDANLYIHRDTLVYGLPTMPQG